MCKVYCWRVGLAASECQLLFFLCQIIHEFCIRRFVERVPRWIRVSLVMHAEIVRLVFICIEYCSVLPNVHSSLLVLSVARLWAMTLQFALMLTHTDEHFVGGQIDVVLANVCFLWWVKCRLHDSFFAHSTFVYCQSTSLTSAHLQCIFTHQCIFMQIFMPFITW